MALAARHHSYADDMTNRVRSQNRFARRTVLQSALGAIASPLSALGQTAPANAAPEPAPGRVIGQDDALIYVPIGLQQGKRYPLVVVYSPVGDAKNSIMFWRNLAESWRLIVYASKTYRNAAEFTRQEWQERLRSARSYVDQAVQRLPVDNQRVIFSGWSGGGAFAHCMNLYFPGLASGVIVNTGHLWDVVLADFKQRGPQGVNRPSVVLLASRTDHRYADMQRDYQALKRWGYDVGWLEFEGGHVPAPHELYSRALARVLRVGAPSRS
jgi:predicted esterase